VHSRIRQLLNDGFEFEVVDRQFRSIDFRGQMILLGTGTSVGVPAIGCGCPVCTSSDPRNNRTRSGAILGLPDGNLLIDTSPDLRHQLLREGIGMVNSVLFTHEHADHLHGLDDLRLFPFLLGHPVPLFCTKIVETRIRKAFDYAFVDREQTHLGAIPQLQFHTIVDAPFETLDQHVQPIPLVHGPHCNVLGFRFGNVAYCTDTNFISDSSMDLLRDLDVLVLDALRFTQHPTHFSVDEAVEVAAQLRPKMTYLTHISHDLDHEQTNQLLPAHVRLAYDGLRIPLT
jgi:phosphoribosyl 1,2-cyclic phosphate phosphodiesterase